MSREFDSAQIEEQASQWLTWRESADWSQSDEASFQAWLAHSTAHKVAFVRLEAVWKQARRLKALGAEGLVSLQKMPVTSLSDEAGFSDTLRPPASGAEALSAWKRPFHAAVACIVLALAGILGWHVWPSPPEFSTPVGGFASVPMRDGSNVALNTGSHIQVAVTETERRVNLQQGEAFFEVAKDPHRPFVVTVDNLRIVAVGTAFSVRRDGPDVRVTVTEGRVRIEDVTGPASAKVSADSDVLILTAGNIARASEAGILVQEKPLPEIEDELSWRTGYLVFRNMALANAVAEFNRYNEREIYIEDPAVAGMRVSGKFRSTQFEAFARLLEAGFPIQVQHVGNRIMLTSRYTGPATVAQE